MSHNKLRSRNEVKINRDTLFTIMGKLSLRQRAVLSLRYFEKMSTEQIAYILGTGYCNIIWHLLTSHIRLKMDLITNGYRTLSLKGFLIRFRSSTKVPYSSRRLSGNKFQI